MSSIEANIIDTYRNGEWKLAYAVQGGTIPRQTKEGVVDLAYHQGDRLLVDKADNVIVGPVGLAGAVELAELILEGNSRALTDPKAILVLAAAVVGFAIETDPTPEIIEGVMPIEAAANG